MHPRANIYTRIHMHASTQTYIHAYIHTDIYTYKHIYIHTCIHTDIHIKARTHRNSLCRLTVELTFENVYQPNSRVALHRVAVCCSVLQRVAMTVAPCCTVLYCVAVCCVMMQCVAMTVKLTFEKFHQPNLRVLLLRTKAKDRLQLLPLLPPAGMLRAGLFCEKSVVYLKGSFAKREE